MLQRGSEVHAISLYERYDVLSAFPVSPGNESNNGITLVAPNDTREMTKYYFLSKLCGFSHANGVTRLTIKWFCWHLFCDAEIYLGLSL